ncbi:MAG: Uma2 family endonuclease [Methylobacteriaceae bacterium]|nr:Uma2 family endonuclease [Methylobacteriaceae bacterium]
MRADAAAQPMTVDEFLAWADGRDGRYELESGQVVAMAPANLGHARTKAATFLGLSGGIAKSGLDCACYVDGPAVRVDVRTSYVPDIVVQCGPQPPDAASELDRPMIVVEVLSPSTAYRDLGVKLAGYFEVTSIAHYLIVDVERRRVIHHARGPDGTILTALPTGGDLRLDPPGLTLPLAALFPEEAS